MKLTELQEKWLQELESGKHAQTKSVLFDGKGYCCLGVACRFVFGIEPTMRHGDFLFGDKFSIMPMQEWQKLGLNDGSGRFSSVQSKTKFHDIMTKLNSGIAEEIHKKTSLAEYNDKGATFTQIAAAIRACPEAVFTTSE